MGPQQELGRSPCVVLRMDLAGQRATTNTGYHIQREVPAVPGQHVCSLAGSVCLNRATGDYYKEVGRWLSGYQQTLLLQKTQLLLPAPTSGSHKHL